MPLPLRSLREALVLALIFSSLSGTFAANPPSASPAPKGIIAPKKIVVEVRSNKAVQKWDYQFHSLQQFTDAISQPALTILTTGQTKQIYCVLMRHRDDLLVACWPRKGGRVLRMITLVTNAYGFQTGVVGGAYAKDIPLILTDVLSTRPKVIPAYGIPLMGASFSINPAFHGILKAAITVWNKKFRNGAHLGGTIVWQ